MKSFCPSCGKKESEKQFISGFCVDCYLKDHDLFKIPKEIEIEVCEDCKKFKLGKKLVEYTEENVEKLIVSKANPDMDVEDLEVGLYPQEKKVLIKIQVEGKKDDVPVKLRKEIYLKEKKMNCPACSRLNGGYFEATLQVRFDKMQRGEERKLLVQMHDILNFEKEKGDNLAQVVRLVERKDGFDARIGSKKAARKIAREFSKKNKAKLTTSTTLITEKKGVPVYRDTICVRLS